MLKAKKQTDRERYLSLLKKGDALLNEDAVELDGLMTRMGVTDLAGDLAIVEAVEAARPLVVDLGNRHAALNKAEKDLSAFEVETINQIEQIKKDRAGKASELESAAQRSRHDLALATDAWVGLKRFGNVRVAKLYGHDTLEDVFTT
jgi:hypothetical protein